MHVSLGVYSAKVCETLHEGFCLKLELPPVLPAELDSSGKHSHSHPGAGLPQPQPSSSSSSSSGGPGCLADQQPTHLQVGLAFSEHQLGPEYL